jgi:hypothetical protein
MSDLCDLNVIFDSATDTDDELSVAMLMNVETVLARICIFTSPTHDCNNSHL